LCPSTIFEKHSATNSVGEVSAYFEMLLAISFEFLNNSKDFSSKSTRLKMMMMILFEYD